MKAVVIGALVLVGCSSPCKRLKKIREVTRHQNKVLVALKTERSESVNLKRALFKTKTLLEAENRLNLSIDELIQSNKAILKALKEEK
ncbi:MAG: hypothetical protein H6624_16770 [Bdellovibrionaceae bacterium]|nr:hypothetical protein [Bdellovibrionales bacterium]MCB9085999.1 hypothetical protein [Pseudobdellovibrionaceae bacterium]